MIWKTTISPCQPTPFNGASCTPSSIYVFFFSSPSKDLVICLEKHHSHTLPLISNNPSWLGFFALHHELHHCYSFQTMRSFLAVLLRLTFLTLSVRYTYTLLHENHPEQHTPTLPLLEVSIQPRLILLS